MNPLIKSFHLTQKVFAMESKLSKTIIGGLAGFWMMSLIMKYTVPMMVGQSINFAALLGSLIGGVYEIGLVIHVLLGVLVFPLVYACLLFRFLPGVPLVKGLLFGQMLWLITATMVMPMTGIGFFMTEIGGIKVALAALVSYWIYGALLGGIAGNLHTNQRNIAERPA
ncbi:MAG: hypothetical protein DHS20C01_35610 [marine bacterium B5-7]|nr:MAG: hypothetical protein DHS20C01_35610 [marine bacterium B5-7]